MTETAIILAGGFGTRLKQVVSDVPKPMAPVNGKPFLEYLLKYLKHAGISTAVLSTGYMEERIREYFANEHNGMRILYSHEQEPLGTGGGIRLAMEKVNEEQVLVLNGDSYFDIDLKQFMRFHDGEKAWASLALRRVNDASRYGEVKCDGNGTVTGFEEKNERSSAGSINGGIYLLDRKMYLENTRPGNFSVEKDYFSKWSGTGKLKAMEFKGYFIDIGIPEDYKRAQDEFKGFAY